jgi:hypothetical protein
MGGTSMGGTCQKLTKETDCCMFLITAPDLYCGGLDGNSSYDSCEASKMPAM